MRVRYHLCNFSLCAIKTPIKIRSYQVPILRGCLCPRGGDLREVSAEVIRDGEGRVDITRETPSKEYTTLARAELHDAPLNLRPEVSHQALNGPRRRVAEGTNRAAFYLFTVEICKQGR